MPCEACNTQFNIFKRKKGCTSCQRLYCTNCLSKRRKNICFRCEIFLQKPAPTKKDLMDLKTKDLIFYLQSKKINIAGIVEKEELANLIINHVNSSSYYETATTGTHSSTSTTPNHDFDNYAQSFDQIKQTCQNLFTSISDKIASDFQKTTCFNQPPPSNRPPTTQQPRRSTSSAERSNPISPQSPTASRTPPYASNHGAAHFRANIPHDRPSSSFAGSRSPNNDVPLIQHGDCDCFDDEINEISEKRQSIVDGNPGPSGCSNARIKITNSSSSDSSSFEEVEPPAVKLSDENWQIIEKTASNGIRAVDNPPDELSIDDINMTVPPSPTNQTNSSSIEMTRSMMPESVINPEVRRLTRRRSDSSLLSLRKSNSITIDMSSFDPTQSASEVKKLKISCNKCGKAKTNIKREIVKLSEQLKSSNHSESEVNSKIKEFLDYLESKSQPSEMTETDDSQMPSNHDTENQEGAQFIPTSSSHDEIEENVLDENEGINVYPSSDEQNFIGESSTPRRFISLDDIQSSNDLESLSVKQLKEILMLNRVDFKGCCEKKELKERVQRLWQDHVAALPSEELTTDDLCKICMDAPIECVFLECGHMSTCIACGKVLNECPICRSYIVRVVRIFKS